MTIQQLLSEISETGVQLWAEGKRLRYRTPKGTLTQSLRAQLTEHRSELLALMQDYADSVHLEPLPTLTADPARGGQPFPLTDIQKAYLIGRNDAIELGGVACHAYVEFENDDLDLPRLNEAWRRLVQRHDMLRTIIREDGLQQVLADVPDYAISLLDLRHCVPEAQAARLAAVREELSHQVLPIDHWPLFDIRASRIDDRRTRLHMSLDLLVGDGWSFFLMFREFQQLYKEVDTPLPPLDISFRDYVLAEQEMRHTARYWRCQSYWNRRLPTLPPAPELPLTVNPSSVKPPRFVRHTSRLEAPDWSRLKTRATEAGLTASGVLLTAFSEVLAAWSRHPSHTINVTLFNRLPLHEHVERIMGDFTGTTLLEVQPNDGSFKARARRLQGQLWEDLEHSYVSGVNLLRDIARVHGTSLKATMPVVFTSLLAHTARDARLTRGKEAAPWSWLGEMVYGISQTPQVWLDHQVLEEAGCLIFNWDAVEQLFPAGLLDDMFDAYCRFLQRLVHDDTAWETPTLCFVPPDQLEQQRAVNATEAPIPGGLLQTRCLQQAAQHPERPAIITTDRTLSYGEVVHRANQIARQLRAWDARPNTLIAIVMEKGWEQVVAALGILQAGAAYLPLDARQPQERLWQLLAQSEATIALTQSSVAADLVWPEGIRHLCVDTLPLAATPAEPLRPLQQPDDLAYVIYTSGSTGMPKGVMIDHRGAVNTIIDLNERFAVGPNDRILALSSLSFDLSVYDIFGALSAGAALVIPAVSGLRDPAHWADLVVRDKVTIWNSVPALMEMFANYIDRRLDLHLGSLRLVMLSGDWIPITLPNQIRGAVPDAQIIGMGGATEASIWSIIYPIGTVDPAWKSIPYGKPMRNQHFYVLNSHLEPVPTWVPGQLYIGGIGLALGYWRDEAKTREKFIIHPRTGERLYRTGDLGRYLPDGTIEFLGREDFQVKIQGYRIELGEIEAALQQHPAVAAAAVTTCDAPRDGKQLVAYVVPRQDDPAAQPEREPDAGLASSTAHVGSDPELLLDVDQRHAFRTRQPGLRPCRGQPTIRLADGPPAAQIIPAYLRRRTYRRFVAQPIPFAQFSQFLASLRQLEINGTPRHRYASAGSLYPVQTYLAIKPGRVEGVNGGIYYYHPKQHVLTLLTPGAALDADVHYDSNQQIFEQAAFSIMLIGKMKAIEPLYGSWSRDFCLLEAGYISQLLMTAGPEVQIGLCPIGSMHFDAIRPLFQLDQDHILLHSHLAGMVEASEVDAPGVITSSATPARAAATPTATTRGLVPDDLRDFLKAKLPSYMIPNVVMFLDALPLTANGKVDRRALPEPVPVSGAGEQPIVAPRTEDEALLARLWSTAIGCETIGVSDNFFEIGGNSLSATRLIVQVREQFGIEVPLRHLFEAPTIAELAQVIAEIRDGRAAADQTPAASSGIDLEAEVVLDAEIAPTGVPPVPGAAPEAILLTGASGFLGTFLLEQLLRQTSATIYCLVRAATVEQGEQRLRQALQAYRLWDEAFGARIVAVLGDLALPRFGLSPDHFASLAQTVDSVFHNGATVNFMYPYQALKAANVQGTAEIFRFAGAQRLKPVHITSSLAVFGAARTDAGLRCEQDIPQSSQALGTGYAQSKWVAEQIAHLARARGFPVHIYRPGTIAGDSRSGAFSHTQFICALIQCCVQLGSAPQLDMLVNMTPVDYVSRAMVYLSQHCCAESNATWHLVNPQPISWASLVHWMATAGFPLREVPYSQWQSELRALAQRVAPERLHPLVPLLIDEHLTEDGLCRQLHALDADCRHTLNHLADALISCPPTDPALLKTYFAAFARDGLLPSDQQPLPGGGPVEPQ